MVCTMGCVHTMLRDGERHFKMGSPAAYTYIVTACVKRCAWAELFTGLRDSAR